MDRIVNYVHAIFKKLPRNKMSKRLEATLLDSSLDKYEDLLQTGVSESTAESMVLDQMEGYEEIHDFLYVNTLRRKNILLAILVACLVICQLLKVFLSISSIQTIERNAEFFSFVDFYNRHLSYFLIGWIAMHLLWRLKALRRCTAPNIFKIICLLFSFACIIFVIYFYPSSTGRFFPTIVFTICHFLFFHPQIFLLVGAFIHIGFYK